MARRKTGVVRMNVGVDPRIASVYSKIADRRGMSTSELIRAAMESYLRTDILPKHKADQQFSMALDAAAEG